MLFPGRRSPNYSDGLPSPAKSDSFTLMSQFAILAANPAQNPGLQQRRGDSQGMKTSQPSTVLAKPWP